MPEKTDLFDYRNLEIDGSNLDMEVETQSAKYLYVAELAVRAETAYELFKAQMRQLTAQIDSSIRVKAQDDKRKLTEAGIKSEVEIHPDFIKATRTMIDLRAQRELSKALRESWHMRYNLVRERSCRQRDEYVSLGTSIKVAA